MDPVFKLVDGLAVGVAPNPTGVEITAYHNGTKVGSHTVPYVTFVSAAVRLLALLSAASVGA